VVHRSWSGVGRWITVCCPGLNLHIVSDWPYDSYLKYSNIFITVSIFNTEFEKNSTDFAQMLFGLLIFFEGGKKKLLICTNVVRAEGKRQALLQFFLLQMCLPLCVGVV